MAMSNFPAGPTPERFIKGKSGKAHIDWPSYRFGNNGRDEKILAEPVPVFLKRPGDKLIQAETDNNTMIVLGRDRTGRGESKENTLGKGSFGDHMGAGAIDIVVGRGAPFVMPLQDVPVSPMFNTIPSVDALLPETFTPIDGELEGVKGIPHPLMAMDAARIYISQMSKPDTNFKIKRLLRKPQVNALTGRASKGANITVGEEVPNSIIMIKADRARIHARKDIKLVTSGEYEKTDSQGEPIMETGGVHLMAGNQSKKQQPIPLGSNLENCLINLAEEIDKLTNLVYKFADTQMEYNLKLASHRHISPHGAMEVTPSPTVWPEGTKTAGKIFKNVISEINIQKAQIEKVKTRFLTKSTARNEKTEYINSRYNTTN
tara:strand:+ start:8163 stop:9287 length:1125 start_codon:yes stop_codon:yes gene_type:complete